MRKFISILVFISYFNSAFAVGIDIHFCGGQVVDIKLVGFGHAHCDCPAGSMPKDCCRNEFLFCKTDNHKNQIASVVVAPESLFKVPLPFLDYIGPLAEEKFDEENIQTNNHSRSKFTPSWPLYVLNKNYRL